MAASVPSSLAINTTEPTGNTQGEKTMFIVDLRHYLDDKGAIGPRSGPGLEMANFVTGVVAYGTDMNASGARSPQCIECTSADVRVTMDESSRVYWQCSSCSEDGVISNWRKTLWDMTESAFENPS
jgi:hypothetical protein